MDDYYDWQIPGTTWEIYDEIFLPAFIGDWSERLADRVLVQPGERVLDVACGTGTWALCAGARVGPGGRVVGLDINPDMLTVARRKQPSPAAAPVEWREGSADALPFVDASFDVVCCQLGMMFFPDCTAALREMRRVLVLNGRFVAMVWGRMEKCPGQAAVTTAWARQLGEEAAAGFHRQHSLADVAAMRNRLADAGFGQIDVAWEMGHVRFQSPAHLVRSYAALMKLQVTPEVAEALIGDVAEALAGYMGNQGLIYPIEAVVATGHNQFSP